MKFAPVSSRGIASSVDITLARMGGVVAVAVAVAVLAEAHPPGVIAFVLALSVVAPVSAVIFGKAPAGLTV